MSASREKKVRQQAGGELTEKQRKAQEETAKSKRNGVLYTVIGAVCVLAVIALLVWNSGFFQGRAAAVSIDGKNYPAADVQYYFTQTYNQYYMQARYGMDIGLDTGVALKEQMYDAENGVTWYDHVMDEAIDSMTESSVLEKAAKDAGYTLSAEGKKAVDDDMKSLVSTAANYNYSSVSSYLKAAYGKSMTKARLRSILQRNKLAQEYEEQYADSLTYTDEEVEAYYAEHADEYDVYSYEYFFIDGKPEAKTDSAGNTVEATEEVTQQALEEAQEKADAITAKLNAGAEGSAVDEEYEEDSKVTYYAAQKNAGNMIWSLFSDWLREEHQAGDTTLLINEAGDGFYVLRYFGRERDESVSADVRHVLVAAEQDEEAEEPTQEQYDEAKAKAEKLLAEWQAGSATEESFAELAKKESADPGSAENGGLYEKVSASTGFIEEFTNWTLDPARKSGDTGLVQNTESGTKGWHIMYYVKANDPAWIETARTAKRDAEGHEWVHAMTDKVTVERLSGLSNVK